MFVNKDQIVTLRELINQFSIGEASVHQILRTKICMSKVSARWVPKQLTEDQNAFRGFIAKQYLERFNHDDNKFLNSIVTGDEIWVIYV